MMFTLILAVLLIGFYAMGYWMGVRSRRAKIVEMDDFKDLPLEKRGASVVDLKDPLDIDLN